MAATAECGGKVRLVRCPKCENLLPELADYSVYQCGGCGAVLRAKLNGYVSASLSEKSDEGKVGGDSRKSESSMEKGLADSVDETSDVDAKSNNERDEKKENNGHERFLNRPEDKETDEKGVFENGNGKKDEVVKAIGREKEEPRSQIGHEKGPKFSGRISNWQNGERSEMEGFWRMPRAEMESERFSTLKYPYEGSSNSHSSFSNNYAEPWRNHKNTDGANKVQHLEQDRAELLRMLDELKDQLSKSSEVVNNPKEKVRLDERTIPPDPYGGSGPWFSDGSSALNRTSSQFFGPDKHVAGPPYFNYHHDPYPCTSGHEMAMPNFQPSMHNPNHSLAGYGDPFASQMLRRGSQPHLLNDPFPQKPLHPYFPGHYVDTNQDSFEPYANRAMLHQPSCSCFHCYDNKRRGSVPAPPAPNDPMLYHREIPGAFGPYGHNSRTSANAPLSVREKQLHTRWPSDFNSEMGGFVRSRPRKIMLPSGRQHCRPVAGGSPFITCNNCFELLQMPKKASAMVKNHQQIVKCGSCSSEINVAIIDKKLVISHHSETKGLHTRVGSSSNEVVSSRVLRSHGYAYRVGANFSSDDYSSYDFHSVDREPLSMVADLTLNSNKSDEMQSFQSSSPITSEDEDSPEVMTAPRDVSKSIHQPTNASLSTPPAGSPLQEYFDYSSNSNEVSRFGKGNRSSRSEQEKAKIEKITTSKIR